MNRAEFEKRKLELSGERARILREAQTLLDRIDGAIAMLDELLAKEEKPDTTPPPDTNAH